MKYCLQQLTFKYTAHLLHTRLHAIYDCTLLFCLVQQRHLFYNLTSVDTKKCYTERKCLQQLMWLLRILFHPWLITCTKNPRCSISKNRPLQVRTISFVSDNKLTHRDKEELTISKLSPLYQQLMCILGEKLLLNFCANLQR